VARGGWYSTVARRISSDAAALRQIIGPGRRPSDLAIVRSIERLNYAARTV